MSKFSAVADRAEQPQFLGLSEVMAPAWLGVANERVSDSIVTAAVLTSAAFRMRDEGGLMVALRQLTNAVADLERTHANDNDD